MRDARSVRGPVLLGVAVAAIVLALVAPGGAAMPARGAAANRRAAVADAGRLLGRLALPSGAAPLAAEPMGDGGALARPPSTLGDGRLINRHRWWRVDEPVASVTAWVKTHIPSGARLVAWGATGGRARRTDLLTMQWRPVAGVLGDRMLVLAMTGLPGGATGVRADAEVQWILPRPAAERIPGAARVLQVVLSDPRGGRSRSFTVTNPRRVRGLVARIDRLPIVQPGTVICPQLPAGSRLTLLFAASAGGPILAQATLSTVTRGRGSACDPLTLTIRGHHEPALLGAPSVVRAVQGMVHIRLAAAHASAPLAFAARRR
ncbi:MAG TPA: hypothetical protein VFN87_20675 [Solirubrobacteraceae bacterium]|nr:hypothetical protein [Solirubrobacteraceae bacterium]